jgi:metallo-beta-lactamase family protein
LYPISGFSWISLSTTTDPSRPALKAIILAGSGMCTGGRIKHHLVHNISRPESTLLFVGYQARGTLGRILLERPEKVRILGHTYPVRARVEKVNGFSAHADKNELLTWLEGFSKPPQKVFVVHGEKESAEALAAAAREKIDAEVTVPAYLEEFAV